MYVMIIKELKIRKLVVIDKAKNTCYIYEAWITGGLLTNLTFEVFKSIHSKIID